VPSPSPLGGATLYDTRCATCDVRRVQWAVATWRTRSSRRATPSPTRSAACWRRSSASGRSSLYAVGCTLTVVGTAAHSGCRCFACVQLRAKDVDGVISAAQGAVRQCVTAMRDLAARVRAFDSDTVGPIVALAQAVHSTAMEVSLQRPRRSLP
jgi:hypothetical protein